MMSAAFAPDGSRVVAAYFWNIAEVWDVATQRAIAVLQHSGPVSSAAFNSDGSRIVTATDTDDENMTEPSVGTANIWDATTFKEIGVLRGHEDIVRSAAFSHDGSQVVTASDDRTARVWDVKTLAQITVLRGHTDKLPSAAFSADGSRVITASEDRTARIWDAKRGKEIVALRGQWTFYSAAFSSDGTRVITTSSDHTARIWDPTSGMELGIMDGHEDNVWSAAFSPDGSRVVTGSEDGTARIWDVHLLTISAPALIAEVCRSRLRGLSTLTPDEMRLAGYSDGTAEIDVCAGVNN